ncbi:MAG: hypothetical protein PHX14_03050, partial [Syntrophomonadaceae bacterium]|nr:hypothetical protein [Syntrophomonadaceae bacterium]
SIHIIYGLKILGLCYDFLGAKLELIIFRFQRSSVFANVKVDSPAKSNNRALRAIAFCHCER